MTLAATDTGGSNLKNTEYRVDGGTFAVYSAPIVVSADGTHTIEYRSTDNDGNVEATKSLTVKKDAVTPETTASLFPAAPGAGGTYHDPVTLTLTGADATSGVAKIEYQVNQASPFGAFGAPKLAERGARVRHVRPGQQAGVLGGRQLLDRLPLHGLGRQRRDGEVDRVLDHHRHRRCRSPPATLDPAQPGPGRTYAGPVNVNLSANDPAPAGPPAQTFNTNAFGNSWAPNTFNLTAGDKITWNFPATEGQPHDV